MPDERTGTEERNKLYVTAYLGESDLRSLARSLVNMAGVKELAEEMGLETDLSREDLDRDLAVFVPTEQLGSFLKTVKGAGHWHGTIDVYDDEAIRIAQEAGCEQIEDMREHSESDVSACE